MPGLCCNCGIPQSTSCYGPYSTPPRGRCQLPELSQAGEVVLPGTGGAGLQGRWLASRLHALRGLSARSCIGVGPALPEAQLRGEFLAHGRATIETQVIPEDTTPKAHKAALSSILVVCSR